MELSGAQRSKPEPQRITSREETGSRVAPLQTRLDFRLVMVCFRPLPTPPFQGGVRWQVACLTQIFVRGTGSEGLFLRRLILTWP